MRRLLPALLISLTLLLSLRSLALATNYQQCTPSSTCTIGEFLYADDYSPLPSQSCTLSIKDPAGTSVITNQAMTSRADGWYSFDYATSATTGLYTASMCCVPTDGTMCLDKSFEVKTNASGGGSSLTAADVWNYNNRTLTSFGSLVSDIWSSSSRTLTSFGDLVSNIWTYNSRSTTTSGTNSDTDTKLDALQSDLNEQRLLLEKATQEPIITLELYDQGSRVSAKLSESEKQYDQLSVILTSLRTTTLASLPKWDALGNTEKITLVSNLLKSSEQFSSTLSYFTSSWDNPSVSELALLSESLTSTLRDYKASASKQSSADLTLLLGSLSDIELSLDNLNAFLASQNSRANALSEAISSLDTLTAQWDKESPARQSQIADNLHTSVLKLNEYVGAPDIISGAMTPKNIVLALRAILGLNQALLANSSNTPLIGMWLEEGSIVYKASLYNPSKLVSLDARLEFFLPREIKESHILSIDPTLTTVFDPDHDAIKVSADYTLAPLASKTVSLELEDIFVIKPEVISELTVNTQNQVNALVKTNFYSQGLAMKTSIDQLVKAISANQNSVALPTVRIRSYRENMLTLLDAQKNYAELSQLVAQTEASRSLKGFLGGAQAASTWGILVVVLTGFVLIGLYLYRLNPTLAAAPTSVTVYPALTTPTASLNINWANIGIVIFTVLSVIGGIYVMKQRTPTPSSVNQIALPSSTPAPSPTPTPNPTSMPKPTPSTSPTSQIVPPSDGSVNIRNNPSTNANIVMSIKTTTDVLVFDTDEDWSHIGFTEKDEVKGYWVKSEFISPSN